MTDDNAYSRVSVELSAAAPGAPSRDGELLVVGFHSPSRPADPAVPGAGVAEAGARLGLDLAAGAARVPAFRGAVGDHVLLSTGAPVVVGLGLGPAQPAGTSSVADLRAAAMHAGRALRGYRRLTVALVGASEPAAAADRVRAIVEGFGLGCYQPPYSGARAATWQDASVPALRVLLPGGLARAAAVRAAVERGSVAAQTADWVRGLVETPGGALTPDDLAQVLSSRARAAGVAASVWTDRQLRERGFGGVVGVGQGSVHPPRVVELTLGLDSRPAARPGVLGLTGKGITFDSGGINIKKDPAEIAWMKSDMAGAAAVAGAVVAAGRLGLDTGVRAILPLAENMPGGRAIRPGDVLRHPGGRTSEVTDTDCEGRLVLADAVAYLAGLPRSRRPAGIIDVGTLTDAGGVGPALWAAMATDDALMGALLAAGERAGEPGWRLPLVPAYAALMRSTVADLANCSRQAPDSAVLAATYLRTFAGDVPWVHVDNGSSAYLEHEAGGWPEGATGSPGRALLGLLEDRAGAR